MAHYVRYCTQSEFSGCRRAYIRRMNQLRALLTQAPRTTLVVGKTIFLAGAVLVLAAIFGRVGISAENAARAAANLSKVTTLAEIYPQYPTWLVPEGPVGFIVAAVLVLVGMYLTVIATNALKGRNRPTWR
jgi:hypothetical protein